MTETTERSRAEASFADMIDGHVEEFLKLHLSYDNIEMYETSSKKHMLGHSMEYSVKLAGYGFHADVRVDLKFECFVYEGEINFHEIRIKFVFEKPEEDGTSDATYTESATKIPSYYAECMENIIKRAWYESAGIQEGNDTICILESLGIEIKNDPRDSQFIHIRENHIMHANVVHYTNKNDCENEHLGLVFHMVKGPRRIMGFRQNNYMLIRLQMHMTLCSLNRNEIKQQSGYWDCWNTILQGKDCLFDSWRWTSLSWKQNDDKLLAFSMGQHPRLGRGSLVMDFSPDNVRNILQPRNEGILPIIIKVQTLVNFIERWFYWGPTVCDVFPEFNIIGFMGERCMRCKGLCLF
jgi:hypothetical protein